MSFQHSSKRGESVNELEAFIFDELKTILGDDVNFNSQALFTKVKGAFREVKNARKYPSHYSEDTIISELTNLYYDVILNLALYDYNSIGAEFEESHSEGEISRTYVDRNKIMARVLPISVCVQKIERDQ